jgi:acetylornithine deacetylase
MRGLIDDHEVGEILADLVAIPSVNPQHEATLTPPFGEEQVASYVEGFGRAIGLSTFRQTVLPGRDNVVITLPGRDSSRRLLLECHMDTVPGWDGLPGPYEPRIAGGRLYGRGACDVKGTLAAMLAAIRLVANRGWVVPREVVLVAVVDEEHQARGVSHVARHGPVADAAVVGEPTGLAVVVAHKGCVRWRVATTGRSVHSSKAHLGVNAIDGMVDLLSNLRSELNPKLAARDHQLVGAPTMNVCTIHGGVAVNVIPDRCEIEIDRRTVPGETLDVVIAEIEGEIRAIARRRLIDVTVDPPFVVDPALDTPVDTSIVRHLTSATRAIVGEARIVGVPFGTDASKLSLAGIPSVVFGPGGIDLAHTRDEHVALDDVARAAEILATLMTTEVPAD